MNALQRFLRYTAMYLFHVCFVRPVVYLFSGANIRRRYLIPEGPCIVVANHNSHIDTGILMSLFPLRRLKHVHPVAAADYFGQNAFRRTLALTLMNGIPIERRSAPGADPLAPVVDMLRQGDSLIFFPEGSRGQAGVVTPFRAGIGKLVQAFPGLLVVPVFMSGPERIWPRGELIPVPLDSYTTIGKPRSFPPDMDAREIARQVQKSVMALAPPPPPVPGPRPPRPARVAVCSIDPSRRREVFQAVTRRLGALGRTLGLSSQVMEADGEGMREATGGVPVTRSRLLPCFLGKAFRTGGMFKGYKFAEMVERARIDEALDHGRTARFVVGDGSPLVDLLAWAEADFYRGKFDDREARELMRYLSGERRIPGRRWWTFIRKSPEVWLLNVFDLARPPVPDVLVMLDVSPNEAMATIRSRGKTLERFENEEFLSDLRQGYQTVAGALERWTRLIVVTADPDGTDPEAIAGRVERECRSYLRDRNPAVPV